MRMLEKFLVRIPERFNSTIKVAGQDLYLANKFNEFEHRVVEGEVVSTPMKYEVDVQKGDTLYFHHHVVVDKGQKLMYDDDEIYMVNFHPTMPYASQAFAYKDQDGEVHPLSNWVLLEPILAGPKYKSDVLQFVSFEEAVNERGIVTMVTAEMEEHGLSTGTIVGFSKNSDYEINIDGKKYWRMRLDDLLYYVKN